MSNTQHKEMPIWFDGKKINEILFCESFRKEHPMICVNGKFFTVDGAIEDEQELAREIFDAIKFFVTEKVSATVKSTTRIYNRTIVALLKEDRKALKELSAEASEMYEENRRLKYSIASTLRGTYGSDLNLSLYYVQILDYLNEMTKSLVHITRPSFQHIDNNHTGLSQVQTETLMSINADVNEIYSRIIYMFTSNDFSTIDEVLTMRDNLFERLAQATKDELGRINAGESNSRAGMLFLGIISETKTMVLQSRNLLKSRRYFIEQEGTVIRQKRIYE